MTTPHDPNPNSPADAAANFNPSTEPNPYASQSRQPVDVSDVLLRPTGVTVVAVLCILGGLLGVLSGLMQFLQPLFQGMATAFAPSGPAGDAQRDWFAEIEAVNAKYLFLTLGLSTLAIITSLCFFVGGISILKPKVWSATLIRRTLLAAIVLATLQLILFFVVQIELKPVMARQFEVMTPQNQGANPGAPDQSAMMDSLQTMTMIMTYAFATGWFLIKIALYCWGRWYLNRDHVQSYLREASAG